jgi:hypothetical protein
MARPKKTQATGLGDTVESVLKATGIDKVAKFLLGEDCGCDARKEKLNALFPYKKPLCLTETEYEWLKDWLPKKINRVIPSDQVQILAIYNRIFHQRNEYSTCGTCLASVIDELKVVVKTYEEAE